MGNLDNYCWTCHLGENPGLRLKPSPDGILQHVTPDTDTDDAYYELGMASISETSADLCLTKEGLLKICLTEGNVPIELNMAIGGQLALMDNVVAVAIWVIRPESHNPNYRVVITKNAQRFPLGMKV